VNLMKDLLNNASQPPGYLPLPETMLPRQAQGRI